VLESSNATRYRWWLGVTAALAALLLPAATHAAAEPSPPLSHAGRWITDAQGRAVILHGVNEVYKVGSYAPEDAGFDADDAKFLERNGFNAVRLGVIYKGVEPNPPAGGGPAYDDEYLAKIADTQRTLAHRRVFSLLDFHQDLFNEKFQGEGWPDWQVMDDGLPNPQNGFPANYVTNPALNRAFDHFWANDHASGVMLQDEYAAAWRHVAERFQGSPYVLGYEILNEPWPGSVWPTCFSPAGCPAFEQNQLTDFTKRVFTSIRQADPSTLVFYEPLVTFNFGIPTHMGDVGDPRAAFSFHDYCGTTGPDCEPPEELVFHNADARAQQTGDATLNTEFGATNDYEDIGRIARLADEHMTGWVYWQYCGCSDPTGSIPPSIEGIVGDPAKPLSGDNVNLEKLKVLVRPYPQAVAGTPEHYGFDPTARAFDLRYSTERADGSGRFGDGSVSEVSVPALQYPDGYAVAVSGARVVSGQGADILRLRSCRGADTVEVQVTPGRLVPSSRKC
jgi:endoglycosylceramidase